MSHFIRLSLIIIYFNIKYMNSLSLCFVAWTLNVYKGFGLTTFHCSWDLIEIILLNIFSLRFSLELTIIFWNLKNFESDLFLFSKILKWALSSELFCVQRIFLSEALWSEKLYQFHLWNFFTFQYKMCIDIKCFPCF